MESVLGENEPSFFHGQWSQQLVNSIFALLLEELAKGFWIWFSVLEHCSQTCVTKIASQLSYSVFYWCKTPRSISFFSTIMSVGNKNGTCVAQTEAIACSDCSPSKLQDQDPMVCHGTHQQVNLDTSIPNTSAKGNFGTSWHSEKGALWLLSYKFGFHEEALYTLILLPCSFTADLNSYSNARRSGVYSPAAYCFSNRPKAWSVMIPDRCTGLVLNFFLAVSSDGNVTEQLSVNNVSCWE